MRHTLVGAPVALLAAVFALPGAAYSGFMLAAVFDDATRAGQAIQAPAAALGAILGLAIFGAIPVALGACAAVLLGARSRVVAVGVPLVLIALLSVPAALFVARIAPDPGPPERVNSRVLAQIAPAPGATSESLRTFNDSGEWESRAWVTRRIDVLAPGTTAGEAVRHYRGILRATGWQIEGSGRIEARLLGIWAQRPGRRIVVRVATGRENRVELDLR
jgi:hypothetical protein